jgi:TPR repeat protein
MYYEKAALLDLPGGKTHLAYILEYGYGIVQDSNRSKELYISASKDGEIYAINRCKELKINHLIDGLENFIII